MVVGVTLILEGQSAEADMVEILKPLKVGDGHTTSVDEHVGDDKDVPLKQDLVCCHGGWAVGTLSNDLLKKG